MRPATKRTYSYKHSPRRLWCIFRTGKKKLEPCFQLHLVTRLEDIELSAVGSGRTIADGTWLLRRYAVLLPVVALGLLGGMMEYRVAPSGLVW